MQAEALNEHDGDVDPLAAGRDDSLAAEVPGAAEQRTDPPAARHRVARVRGHAMALAQRRCLRCALAYEPIHIMEHVTLLVSGVLLWRVLVGSRSDGVASPGFRILLVFATALQSGFLALLLTFAQSPWYSAYATTTAARHLDPLADQQLAGVIMWIPGGFVYVATAPTLLVSAPPQHDGPPDR